MELSAGLICAIFVDRIAQNFNALNQISPFMCLYDNKSFLAIVIHIGAYYSNICNMNGATHSFYALECRDN